MKKNDRNKKKLKNTKKKKGRNVEDDKIDD